MQLRAFARAKAQIEEYRQAHRARAQKKSRPAGPEPPRGPAVAEVYAVMHEIASRAQLPDPRRDGH
ncbi:MAG: hypothetical protein GEU73_06100 [Chloroflexi bacterium]|nr:hypothetical protein [Chloroflexota bacterium]